jgi:hypothetical protein
MRRTITMATLATLAATALVACGGDDEAASGGDFCAVVAEFKANVDAGDAVFDADEPTSEQLEQVFGSMAESVDAMVDAAPDEIRDDAEFVGETMSKFLSVFSDADYDVMKIAEDPDFPALSDAMESDEMNAAQDRISAYTKEECGIDLDV